MKADEVCKKCKDKNICEFKDCSNLDSTKIVTSTNKVLCRKDKHMLKDAFNKYFEE